MLPFVTMYVHIYTHFSLITCHVPGTMLSVTILILIHNFIIKWTALVIAMTVSKIMCLPPPFFFEFLLYTQASLYALHCVNYLINLHNNTVYYVLFIFSYCIRKLKETEV